MIKNTSLSKNKNKKKLNNKLFDWIMLQIKFHSSDFWILLVFNYRTLHYIKPSITYIVFILIMLKISYNIIDHKFEIWYVFEIAEGTCEHPDILSVRWNENTKDNACFW